MSSLPYLYYLRYSPCTIWTQRRARWARGRFRGAGGRENNAYAKGTITRPEHPRDPARSPAALEGRLPEIRPNVPRPNRLSAQKAGDCRCPRKIPGSPRGTLEIYSPGIGAAQRRYCAFPDFVFGSPTTVDVRIIQLRTFHIILTF